MDNLSKIVKNPIFAIFFIAGILFAYIGTQAGKGNKIAAKIKNLGFIFYHVIGIAFLVYILIIISPILLTLLHEGAPFILSSLFAFIALLVSCVYLSISLIKKIKNNVKRNKKI